MSGEQKRHLISYLQKGIRFDGRSLEEFRKISVEYDISFTAEGSAKVKIGNTELIVGVKLLVGAPFPDTPDDGAIMVNAEFLPLSNPDFESGPPGISSIELARVVDRGIRESKTIDLKSLIIKKGEKCWIVSIDICTINDAGNLQDAAALGTLAALKMARFPEFDGVEIDYKKRTDRKIELANMPLSVTVYKVGDYFIVDPLAEEEKFVDCRLTVTTTEDGRICALQKGGNSPITIDDVSKMVDMALKKAKVLRSKL